MANVALPTEFNLRDTLRYRRQNMTKAMKGKIERGLVELITNTDDSYRDLEEQGVQIIGKIRIEVERKRGGKPSIVKVRDRASGMSDEGMVEKIGVIGNRTSGFEKGKSRRGLYGRGAKDVAAFGSACFESIKDDKYSRFVITASLSCKREAINQRVTKEIRETLGIPRGNGTVVTIEVGSSFNIPSHSRLKDILSRYFSLRDIMANPNREVTLIDVKAGRSDHINYKYPEGKIVCDEDIDIPGYSDAKVHMVIRQHDTPFVETSGPLREGICIKSEAAIHECTYFHLDSDPYSWRFSGYIDCSYIDVLVREYDDKEEEHTSPTHSLNNPILVLDPDRDGLLNDHPFVMALTQKCRQILSSYIYRLKEVETEPKRKVTDDYLNKKLDNLSKEISKIFERKLKELDEDVVAGSASSGTIANLPLGIHIIPPEEEPIIVNVPKVFTVKVVGNEALDEALPVSVESSNVDVKVKSTPVYLRRFSDDMKIGTTTFVIESDSVGAEALIEINYNGYDSCILVTTVEPSPPSPPSQLPEGLSFDKPNYVLKINKEKMLYLWLYSEDGNEDKYIADISSNHRDIVVKGGGKCTISKTEFPHIYKGKFNVLGRRTKVKGIITALLQYVGHAETSIIVEEKEPSSHIALKFDPDEDDFGSVRYKWDEENRYILKIAAKHPSIRQYLGSPVGDQYPGKDSALYHSVLAEVVAEALSFNILERQFRIEGQQGMLDYTTVDANYHRHYSDFLTICHRNLNPDVKMSPLQTKLLGTN